METLKVELQNEQEKKVLLAFLDSLNYHYNKEEDDNFTLTEQEVMELNRRKADLLEGRTTSRPLDEIKKRYESI